MIIEYWCLEEMAETGIKVAARKLGISFEQAQNCEKAKQLAFEINCKYIAQMPKNKINSIFLQKTLID